MKTIKVTELMGDGISAELQQSVHTIAQALPININFESIDLSLENREREDRKLFLQVEEAMRENRLVLKYPTITKDISPNAVIRRMCNFSVILRPVISIKGIDSNFKESLFLYIVRIATGGTYDDPGRLIGRDSAISIRIVERDPCRQAARFAFDFARKKGLRVTSSSKHTIQKVTDGLFQSVVEEVHKEFADVSHNVELFDALLAKIAMHPENFDVVLVLNEYGDFLSDMASGMAGSIGTGASGNFSFTEDDKVDVAMFDPSGGTAPDIAGQNKCNPTGTLLALGMLLDHIDCYEVGHKLRMALLGAIANGECTADIGGKLGTREFTDAIVQRLSQTPDK
ncbi:MAG: isocitrate/isopropylmalate family dehydrogenase [Gammaproteobacteria bacterium]